MTMVLEVLRPQNTKNARSVGVNAFKRFLEAENVALEYVFDCMSKDPNGKCMGAVMDKFALHLVFTTGVKDKILATNTVMSYFRHVKKWLLELFPECQSAIEERLLEMGRILEKHLSKREAGGVTKHAPACTKKDLSLLVRYIYSNATSSTDYQDAALVTMLWHVFGRASDFSLVQKSSVSVCSSKNFFVRLVRMKTTEQQGLTLYPDEDITTCPILAMATALAMQTAPCTQLLENVRAVSATLDLEALETLPLMELLLQAELPKTVAVTVPVSDTKKPNKKPSTPGIHNQINRLLGRTSQRAGVLVPLTSHSFRRGGAQHADGDAGVSMQWISDRGGWNLSSAQKVWSYVFHTTQEDQRVSKILSGWSSNAQVPLDGLEAFDGELVVRVRRFQLLLFNTCTGLEDQRLNMCPVALDACTSRLLRALPMLRVLQPDAPVIRRVDSCATRVGIRRDELLRMAMALQEVYVAATQTGDAKTAAGSRAEDEHRMALLRELLETNRLLVNRLEALEAKTEAAVVLAKSNSVPEPALAQGKPQAPAPRKNAPAVPLSNIWFEWYAGEPRLWSPETDSKKRSEARQAVAMMKLFLPRGFVLDPHAASYRADVMRLGNEAELATITFLVTHGINSKDTSAVVKHMRALHKQGKLNGFIREYANRVAIGAFVDPAPRNTHDQLKVK